MSDGFLEPVDNGATKRQAMSSANSMSVKPDDERAMPMARQQIGAWLKNKEGLESYITYMDEWER